jgi:nucleoside-diphosphate-sugar epimerase
MVLDRVNALERLDAGQAGHIEVERDHVDIGIGGKRREPALAGRLAERVDALIQRTGRYVQQVHVLGEMDKTIACEIGAARAELGYEPTVALEEGMRQSIRWCRDQGLEL